VIVLLGTLFKLKSHVKGPRVLFMGSLIFQSRATTATHKVASALILFNPDFFTNPEGNVSGLAGGRYFVRRWWLLRAIKN
jgi:hypothetical protein